MRGVEVGERPVGPGVDAGEGRLEDLEAVPVGREDDARARSRRLGVADGRRRAREYRVDGLDAARGAPAIRRVAGPDALVPARGGAQLEVPEVALPEPRLVAHGRAEAFGDDVGGLARARKVRRQDHDGPVAGDRPERADGRRGLDRAVLVEAPLGLGAVADPRHDNALFVGPRPAVLLLALDEALTEDLDEQFQNAIFEISQPARGLRKLPLSA